MTNKKKILWISGIISFGLVAIGTFGTYKICNEGEVCINILHSFFLHFLPVLPLFLLSLITYKMRDEVYRVWFRFARWWVPLSMILIFLAPEYSHDWMFSYEKGTVAFFSSILFVAISLIIIAWKYLKLREANS